MRLIASACDEMMELLHEAKEYVKLAMEAKKDCPTLATTYIEMSNTAIAQAEKLKRAVEEYSMRATDEAREYLGSEMERFMDKYEKAKIRQSAYMRM